MAQAVPKDVGTWSYGDIELPVVVKQDVLEEVRNFEVRDDDVWICTYPKSGTHWVRQIIRLLQNNGDFDKMVAATNKGNLYPDPIEVSGRTSDGGFNHIYKFLKDAPSPRCIISHLPLNLLPKQVLEKKPKVIYVARNPKDNAVSLFHYVTPAMKVFGIDFPFEALVGIYMTGKQAYGPWACHVLPFWEHRDDTNVLFLKYEDMKADHIGVVRKISAHLGYSLSEEVIQKTVENTNVARTKQALILVPQPLLAPALGVGDVVRKGIVGDWKSHFTEAQSEAFDRAVKKDLIGSGLDY